MFKIVNWTPHEVTVIHRDEFTVSVYPPSGEVARVSFDQVPCKQLQGYFEGIDVVETLPTHIVFPREPRTDEVYIVSTLCLQNIPAIYGDEYVFVSPNKLVLNDKGQVVGCQGFQTVL